MTRLAGAWLVEAGCCRHLEAVVMAGGAWRVLTLPVWVGVLLHPRHGLTLFDSGYAPRVKVALRRGRGRVYRALVPFVSTPARTAAARLRELGFDPLAVRRVVISHFHPDHIGGLRDFPQARFVVSAAAWRALRAARGWRRLRLGLWPELLPEDFAARVEPIERCAHTGWGPFESTHDLFGDASLRLVELPGHAPGQLGALVELPGGGRALFAADACWLSRAGREGRPPAGLTRVVTGEAGAARATLARLQDVLHSGERVRLVPSHCPELREGELTCA